MSRGPEDRDARGFRRARETSSTLSSRTRFRDGTAAESAARCSVRYASMWSSVTVRTAFASILVLYVLVVSPISIDGFTCMAATRRCQT